MTRHESADDAHELVSGRDREPGGRDVRCTQLDDDRLSTHIETVASRRHAADARSMTETAPLDYSSPAVAGDFGYGFHHLQLCLPPDEESAAREFYVGILGMVEVRKPPVLAARGGLWVRADDIEIHLGAEKGFQAPVKAHPGISVRHLDALDEHLRGRGVTTTWDDDFPGMRRFYVRDPFGNRIEFLQPEQD